MVATDPSGAVWRKSSRSGSNSNCVEIAVVPRTVAIRDSKAPEGPIVVVSRDSWKAFVVGVKDGEFDLT